MSIGEAVEALSIATTPEQLEAAYVALREAAWSGDIKHKKWQKAMSTAFAKDSSFKPRLMAWYKTGHDEIHSI